MNKLLLVSMLVMLCIANVNAARFLEDTVKTPAQETEAVAPAPVETKPEENTEVVDEKATEQKPQEPTTPVPETENKETPKNEEVEKKETTEDVPPVINEKESEKPKEEAKTQEEAKPEEKKEVEEEKKEQKEEQKEKEEESPIAPISEDDKKNSGYFGLSIGFVLFLALGVLFFFVGFYRYSLRKYKIPPFSPPTFCPNFLFPRPENDLLMEDYCIQSGTEMGGVYSSEKYHNFY